MLRYEDDVLAYEGKPIEDSSFTLTLEYKKNRCIVLVMSFEDETKTVAMNEYDGTYAASVVLTTKEAYMCEKAKAHLIILNEGFEMETNDIEIPFSKNAVISSAKAKMSTEMSDLKIEIARLNQKINSLTEGKVLQNISVNNSDYLEPGMVLMCIDGKNFIGAHPFANIVHEVNGQKAINGVVVLDASMIEYMKGVTVLEYMKSVADAVKGVNDFVKTLKENVSELTEKLNALVLDFNKHISSGII